MAEIKYKDTGVEIVGDIQAANFKKPDGTNAIPSKTSDLTNDSDFITSSGATMNGNINMSGTTALVFGSKFKLVYNSGTQSLDIEVV